MSSPSPRPLPSRRPGDRAGEESGGRFGALASPAPDESRLREVALDAIRPNADQPRRRFNEASLERLADSLRERGVLQPVLLRTVEEGAFELIAGERRWRAARLAGLMSVPAYVRGATEDGLALELGLIENAAREDLSVTEEARALKTLVEDLGLTQETLAARVAKSRSDVANTLRVLDLAPEVLELLDAGALTKGHGKALLTEPDAGRRLRLAQRAAADGWSVRRLEQTIRAATPNRAEMPAPAVAPDGNDVARRLGSVLGLAVRVRSSAGGLIVQITLPDVDSARALAARLETSLAQSEHMTSPPTAATR